SSPGNARGHGARPQERCRPPGGRPACPWRRHPCRLARGPGRTGGDHRRNHGHCQAAPFPQRQGGIRQDVLIPWHRLPDPGTVAIDFVRKGNPVLTLKEVYEYIGRLLADPDMAAQPTYLAIHCLDGRIVTPTVIRCPGNALVKEAEIVPFKPSEN